MTWVDPTHTSHGEGSSEIQQHGDTIVVIEQMEVPATTLEVLMLKFKNDDPRDAILRYMRLSSWKYAPTTTVDSGPSELDLGP